MISSQNNMPNQLSPGSIFLFFTYFDDVKDQQLIDEYKGLLNQEEQSRHKRFILENSRNQFLISRALIRTVLSSFIHQDPTEVLFTKNQYGKPELAQASCNSPIRFNLSHTDGLCVCAVTVGKQLGVDVENLDRKTEYVKVSKRFFSPQEALALSQQSEESLKERFFEFWTLKESYIKARGMGMAIPLEKFYFDLHEKGGGTFQKASDLKDSIQWQFYQWTLGRQYIISLATEPQEAAIQFSTYRVIPLRSTFEVRWNLSRMFSENPNK